MNRIDFSLYCGITASLIAIIAGLQNPYCSDCMNVATILYLIGILTYTGGE